MKKIKKYAMVIVLLLLFFNYFAQDISPIFVRPINGSRHESATGLAVDEIGNMFLFGIFSDSTHWDPYPMIETSWIDGFITKLDPLGNILWVERIGSMTDDFSGDIFLGQDGVYLHGAFEDSMIFNNEGSWDGLVLRAEGVLDSYLAKYSLDGEFLWAKRMGEPTEPTYELPNFNIGADGLYLTSGFYDSINFNTPSSWESNVLHSNGGLDIYVAKYDFDGNLQWLRSYGSSSDDNGINIEPYQGGYYLCGYFEDSLKLNDTTTLYADVEKDAFLVKFAENGDCMWARRAGGYGSDMAIYVSLIGNELYLSGTCDFSMNFNTPSDISSNYFNNIWSQTTFLGKYNSDGTFLWGHVLNPSGTNRPTDMEANENGIYMTGYFDGSFQVYDFGQYTGVSADFAQDIYLLKIGSDGHLRWLKRAGGDDSDISSDLEVKNNKIYLLGYTWSSYYNFNTPSSNESNVYKGKGFSDIFLAVYEEGYAGLNELIEQNNLSIYPNPSTGEFRIEMSESCELAQINITDIEGRTISYQILAETNTTKRIKVENAPTGLYFVRVLCTDGASFVSRILIR